MDEFYRNDTGNVDLSWYALYNTILASGARVALSASDATSFENSIREASGYFERALSFLPDLAEIQDGWVPVQTVTAMASINIFC